MTARTWPRLFALLLVVAAGVCAGQEVPPGGAEKELEAEDLRYAGLSAEGLAAALGAAADLPAPDAPRVAVADLPPPDRTPVLYLAFDAGRPLRRQLRRAVAAIERCGPRSRLVLSVRRCASAPGSGRGADSLARRRAESVAALLRRKGFKTEVNWGRVKTFCLAPPARLRKRGRPVEVTVNRLL